MYHLFATFADAGCRVYFIGMFLEIYPFKMRGMEKEEGDEEMIRDEVWNFESGVGGEYL